MEPKVTPKQIRIFQEIVAFKEANDGNSPTVRYLANKLKCSVSVIDYYLSRLEDKGLIERIGDIKSRNIHVVGGKWIAPQQEQAAA